MTAWRLKFNLQNSAVLAHWVFPYMKLKPVSILVLVLITFSIQRSCLAGNEAERISFVVLGDWGTGEVDQKRVATQLHHFALENVVDFIVTTGDNFYPRGVLNSEDPLWQSNFENIYDATTLLTLPWYVTLGNHDYLGNINAQINYATHNRNWILPDTYHLKDFSSEKGPALRLIFLDTNPYIKRYLRYPAEYRYIDEQKPVEQTEWLSGSLKSGDFDWKIAFGHHPVYSAGAHGGSPELASLFPPIFEEYGLSAYFAGHDHHLEHYKLVGNTHYFISGGGANKRRVSKKNFSEFVSSSLGFAYVVVEKNVSM